MQVGSERKKIYLTVRGQEGRSESGARLPGVSLGPEDDCRREVSG